MLPAQMTVWKHETQQQTARSHFSSVPARLRAAPHGHGDWPARGAAALEQEGHGAVIAAAPCLVRTSGLPSSTPKADHCMQGVNFIRQGIF